MIKDFFMVADVNENHRKSFQAPLPSDLKQFQASLYVKKKKKKEKQTNKQ